MRIQFLKEIAVNLADLPTAAWGRVQIRHTNTPPVIDNDQFCAAAGESGYVFPKDAVVNLPEELAQKYINAGVAELNIGPNGHYAGEWPEDLKPKETPA